MIPLYLGRRERLLFGAYSPALGQTRGRGVVLCNPWGVEALRAHRSLRFLADTLAEDGVDVLRFDYYGTGDSLGDGSEVTLEGCVLDALCAVEELGQTAGIERVDLIGLRFGALVAALAVERLPGSARTVLWDPVTAGSELLQELLKGGPAGRTVEVDGFALPAEFQSELAGASVRDGHGGDRLVALSAATAAPVEEEGGAVIQVQALPCWVEERDFGAGAVPVELIRRIVEWL